MILDSKYKSLLESVVLLGSALVLVVIISLSFTTFLGNSDMPNVAVSTGSMLPIYNGFQDSEYSDIYPFRGDILLVKKVPVNSIEVGDVIVFDTISISDPVVHRVIAKWQEGDDFFFKTNGDNNISPDSWEVEGEDVIGLVVIRIPHVGWFLLVLQTDLGKFIILIAAALILFGEDLFPLLGITKKKPEKNTKTTEDKIEKEDNKNNLNNGNNVNILRRREFIYSFIGLLILFIFLSSSLITSITLSPALNCYQINDTNHNNSLFESGPSSPIALSTTSDWLENSESVYFFPVLIKITSGGVFNNIDRFEILINQTEGNYVWNTVYNFAGVRVIEGGIVSHILGNVEVTINMYSRGLLANSLQTYSFYLLLNS